MKELLEEMKIDEGFSGVVYKCSEGFDTIGYGTRLPLDKEESAMILEYRLKQKIKELESKEPFVNELPLKAQEILANMSYQMGVNGVLKFKNMWRALKEQDYERASVEMLDSTWHVQTPNRAKKLAKKMREI